tara:strand:- start:683 stop:919 length:237 start_codon:yes stop_codon:yes gene_type:complete
MQNEKPKRDRRERFTTLANKRVNKTLKQIRLVGNLCDQTNYTYTEEETEKMYSALDDALKTMKKRFNQADKAEPPFKL